MNNLIKLSLATIFMLVWSQTAIAQQKKNNFREGVIEYELNLENADGMIGMLNGSTMTWSIQNKNNKIDLLMAGGFAKVGLLNSTSDNLYAILLDIPMLMERTAIEMDDLDSSMDDLLDWTEDEKKNQAPKKEDVTITYNKSKKKKIGKYSCYQATVKLAGMDDVLTVYVTDALRSEAVAEVQSFFGNMKGFPLEFQLNIGGVMMTMTAKSVTKKKLDKETFVVPEDYAKQSLDEFKDSMEEEYGKDSMEEEGTFGL